MKVTLEITNEQIKNLLCTAFEGGSNYWARIDSYKYAKGLEHKDFQDGGKFQVKGNYWHPSQIIPLVEGCAVIIKDMEDSGKTYTLNLETIHKGMAVMAEKYSQHFSNFYTSNDDAITGDVFLQCCLFGKIIYG